MNAKSAKTKTQVGQLTRLRVEQLKRRQIVAVFIVAPHSGFLSSGLCGLANYTDRALKFTITVVDKKPK